MFVSTKTSSVALAGPVVVNVFSASPVEVSTNLEIIFVPANIRKDPFILKTDR